MRVAGKCGGVVKTLLLILSLALSACTTTPRYINGHKVKSTRYDHGHLVYVLGPNDEDRAAMLREKKRGEEAAKEIVFDPVK